MSEKEYIERGALVDDLERELSGTAGYAHRDAIIKLVKKLNAIPAADVEPVVRGEWVEFDEDMNAYICSICREPYVLIDGTPEQNHYNYCPNCGSHMQEKPNE